VNVASASQGMGKIGRVERKAVALSAEGLVEERPLAPQGVPLVLRPTVAGVDLAGWASDHRGRIDQLLLEHRALLFRGFSVGSVEVFQAFVAASSSGDLLQYRDRSTPRYELGGSVYISTIYPAAETIRQHNEGTYWMAWPLKIYFACLKAPEQGGATPICDVRQVYARIPEAVRERFAERRVMYVRNYNIGVGLTWQEAYQTSDRREVEEYCHNNRIAFEWLEGERLRTRQIRPAIRKHPQTGEPVWFNHAAFFHISSQEEAVRRELLAAFPEDSLPYNTFYGDGGEIEPEALESIRAAYADERISFPWQEGDVLMLDNMTMAHGREPYVGERKVAVAMVDKQEDEADA
jgi:alpha-ketoglutarate-dependent taurine dioxygenase